MLASFSNCSKSSTPYTCKSKSVAAESKDMHMKVNVGRGESNAIDDMKIFPVVPIGGAIVRPC